MLNNESVVTWFKGLDGDERVDLMCLLLDCCLPWEVRFFGTYLESLAQKDFAALRGPESTANNPSELGYLYCIEDSETRKRLCVSVALLHSTNRQAAGVLFDILNDLHVQLFGTSAVEDEIFTELSLLLTMTSNHPAFSFNQKNILRSKLKQLRECRSSCSDWSEECFETISESSTTSSTFFSDPDPTDNDEENQYETEKCGVESRVEKKHISESDETKHSPSAHVKDFKVVKIQKKCECKSKHEARTKRDDHEYVLEVSWSDDSKETICKTYEEMFDFQCKLRKLFPTKVDEKGQPWKLPFLPGRLRPYSKEHKNSADRAPIPDINDYARHFGSSLPIMVLGCEHVVRFFESYKNPRLPDSKSRKVSLSKTKKASKTEEKTNSKGKDSEKNKDREKGKGNRKETIKVLEKGKNVEEEKQKEKEKFEFKVQDILQCSESRKVLKDRKKNVTSRLSESMEINGFVEDTVSTTNSNQSITNCRLTKNEIFLRSKQPKPNLDEKSLDREQVNNLIGKDENQNHLLTLSSSPSISSSFGSSTSSSSGEENNTNSSLTDHSQIVASLIRNMKKNGISKSVIPSVKPSTAAVTSGSMAPTFTTASERDSTSPISSYPFSHKITPYSVTNGIHDLSSLPNFVPNNVPQSLSNSPQFHTFSESYQAQSPCDPSSSLSFRRRSKLGSMNWTFKSHSHSMTVRDWLKSLRLHKYFDLFQHKTFDQMLKISDKDMESLKMPLGARRKLRANLEVLRSRGCFTADGNAVVDILSTPAVDDPIRVPYVSCPTNGFNLTCGSGVPYSLPPPGTSVVTVSKMVSMGDSDSASECGSDAHSESNCNIVQMPCKPLNGCRLFCYNCGSLGHVGGQCMAPNMEKRIKYYGFHLKYDSL